MTRYLLDTNAIVIGFSGSARLSERARDAIEDRTAERLVSAASVYEIAWKHRIGKLDFTPEMIRAGVHASGLVMRAATDSVMEAAATLAWDHRDPWDRIIAAQAIHDGATIISTDAAFDALRGIERVW